MKASQAFTYVFTTICFYIGIFMLEVFILMPIIDGVEIGYLTKMGISIGLLIVVNPIITWQIMERLPFKPKDLRASADYKSDIRKRPQN